MAWKKGILPFVDYVKIVLYELNYIFDFIPFIAFPKSVCLCSLTRAKTLKIENFQFTIFTYY